MERLEPQPDRTVTDRVGLAARRVVITVVGGLVALAGVVMLLTPGPGLVTLAAGLAILATEYAWAKRALRDVRRRSREAYLRAVERRRPRSGGPPPVDPGS
jgi:uncharacterized protein (TIGR02611 family)